jgi:hypothetical protein
MKVRIAKYLPSCFFGVLLAVALGGFGIFINNWKWWAIGVPIAIPWGFLSAWADSVLREKSFRDALGVEEEK